MDEERRTDNQDDEDEPQRISLERYMSTRRGAQGYWRHLASAIIMLVALVAIIVYKDRCGAAVSEMMSGMSAPTQPTQPTQPMRPASIQMK